jgi:RNA polymerase sigma factor (TIGR02999 family)
MREIDHPGRRLDTLEPTPPDRTADVNPTIPALMAAVEQGDSSAAEPLFEALYAELHGLAKRELSRRGAPLSVSATTLLHEAYLNIADARGAAFPDRIRFMAYAARVMRNLIIDHVRNGQAAKRGGQFEITSLRTDIVESLPDLREITRVAEAIDQLAEVDASLAEIVDLKFFCGFSFADIAAMRGSSERTVQRHWEKARIYLHGAIGSNAI